MPNPLYLAHCSSANAQDADALARLRGGRLEHIAHALLVIGEQADFLGAVCVQQFLDAIRQVMRVGIIHQHIAVHAVGAHILLECDTGAWYAC